MECIFCKISQKEIPADILYEDDLVIAFPDARPMTPAHILVIPKRHIASLNDLTREDEALAGKLILAAQEVAAQHVFTDANGAQKTVAETGYKLLLRTGRYGGQEVGHIHLHLLGGGKMYEDIGVRRER